MQNPHPTVDAPAVTRAWFATHELRWVAKRISAKIRFVQQQGIDKTIVAFRTITHEANLIVWGSGIVEFIVLHGKPQRETVSRSGKYATQHELQHLLDGSVAEFETLAAEPA